MRKKNRPSTLISFVGINDGLEKGDKGDGPVLTVFREMKFDSVHLIWNSSATHNFETIAKSVKEKIVRNKYSKDVELHCFECKNVTDHNEIYPKLLELCNTIKKDNPNQNFTAAIASGTPAMQVCWILMAESGDFPIRLIRSNEPKFGKPLVTDVKLETGLPRIFRLEEENKVLSEKTAAILPKLQLDCSRGTLQIDGHNIALSPIEFSYYRYFAERAKQGLPMERFSGINTRVEFLRKIVQFHKDSFPEAEDFRRTNEEMLKKDLGIAMATFRGNVTKANQKINKILKNKTLASFYEIMAEGKRHSKTYGLRIPASNITIRR